MVDSLSAAFDTRPPDATGGSGFRVEGDASYQGDLRQLASWLSYGGAVGAFLDLNDHGRVISLSVNAHFADPIGHASIPFTELVQLGGSSPMRAFYLGRLVDRSAAVAELAYRWPIWVWLDGAMRFEVGNVFGAHLDDFAPGLLRFSGSVGLESRQSPDNSLQLLFGLGSETFASGARLDSIRFVVGTTHGF
jgi:outer membrane protein assembly factor BamA